MAEQIAVELFIDLFLFFSIFLKADIRTQEIKRMFFKLFNALNYNKHKSVPQ